MKQKLSRCLAGLLALCLLVAMVAPAFAADSGTATLVNDTMDEDGMIEVTFSKEATESAYYNVQIYDEN